MSRTKIYAWVPKTFGEERQYEEECDLIIQLHPKTHEFSFTKNRHEQELTNLHLIALPLAYEKTSKAAWPDKQLRVPEAELISLRKAAKFLEALQAAGVDNWEGHSVAQDLMEDM